jgi:TolB-like protein/cytochrome c-type biogenesis protein CcmH/NrfG
MQGESRTTASTPTGAVFLSYASEDAEAAKRICEALRASAIEVWFDRAELRGGDAWDQSIRRQIKNCALFIAVVSRHTHARTEGYFRLEWKLAVDRSDLMAANRAFLLPVVVDDTSDDDEHVPEKFHEVQWTRLPGGETPPGFVEHVQCLLSGGLPTPAKSGAAPGVRSAVPVGAAAVAWRRRALSVAAVVALAAVAYLAVDRSWTWKRVPVAPAAVGPAAAFVPPPHSIAVLPFVNMSGDKEQEYFSEGVTEELLNSLSRINELQVAARTSSFSFQDEHPDIATIARKLNVGAVLEGSVRRSGNTVRITTQLINGVTGFHLWSQTYDRDLGDLLRLQTEIATAVASALKITLLSDVNARLELDGTSNPAAFDAYLRGENIAWMAHRGEEHQRSIDAYTQAIQLDPKYALAYAARSLALANFALFNVPDSGAAHTTLSRALADAYAATALAPASADGYYSLGVALRGALEFAKEDEAFTRALALAPGSARILAVYCRHAAEIGRTAAAIDAGRRALMLDPLNFHTHRTVGIAYIHVRQYEDALVAFQKAISLEPKYVRNYFLLGATRYLMGSYDDARKSCEAASADEGGQACLAMTYHKLGRQADAEAMLHKVKSAEGESGAYDYAEIYAQWGDIPKALEWLETAVRLRDPDLGQLKTDPYLDPMRGEPHFQAIERALKLPD